MSAYYNEIEPYAAEWLRNLIRAGLIPNGEVDTRSVKDVSADDVRGFTQCHFFAGIGGWPLALRLAGISDETPLWSGSCPCQPFSAAGKRKGTDDERHLWPEFRRLIAECRPPITFGEQVASKDGRQWLVGVRADLEELGYGVGAADLCVASAGEEGEGWIVHLGEIVVRERITLGAPHIRQRLFWGARLMGDADGARRNARSAERQERGETRLAMPATGSEVCGLGDAERARQDPGREPEPSVAFRLVPELSGGWSDFAIIPCLDAKSRRTQSGLQPLAHGIPTRKRDPRLGYLLAELGKLGYDAKTARQLLREARANRTGRLKGYGNAIVPQLAAEFIRAFMDTEAD